MYNIAFGFDGAAWVKVSKEELIENNISLEDEDEIINYAWHTYGLNGFYEIGGDANEEVIEFEED